MTLTYYDDISSFFMLNETLDPLLISDSLQLRLPPSYLFYLFHTISPFLTPFLLSHQVERRITEEAERAQHFLDPSTEPLIAKVRMYK